MISLMMIPLQFAIALFHSAVKLVRKRIVDSKRFGGCPPAPGKCPETSADVSATFTDWTDVPEESLSPCSLDALASSEDGLADSWRSKLSVSDMVLVFSRRHGKWYTGVVTCMQESTITIVYCVNSKMSIKDLPRSSPRIEQALTHDEHAGGNNRQ
eukprot:TRINITY_DN59674_c0_g1_i1.p1 TRINITY_DN59674_c0_g1~~TRINITY_DN59674_c0_g1_i1.p1  ORF type:complete len:156 (-),score=19.92 TRINITY_DN59674_c0_g1_i1:90-557(-)